MPAVARPFAAIPAEAAAVLRPVLPGLADEMIHAIALEVPDYARAMEGEFGRVVRLGVESALGRFVDLIEDPTGDDGRGRATYVNLGRGEMRAGRSLDALLAAYRLGSPPAPRPLGAAGEGSAEERSPAAGERQRLRRRLVRLLAQAPPAGEETVLAAAAAASWPLPRTLPARGPAPEAAAAGAAAPAVAAEADALAARLARRVGEEAIGAGIE